MSTKFLDLDEIAVKEEIAIKLNGKRHVYKEMSVDDFVWAQKIGKGMIEGTTGKTEEELVDIMVMMLNRHFPTIPIEELRATGMGALRRLYDFVMKISLTGSEEASQPAKSEDTDPKKAEVESQPTE